MPYPRKIAIGFQEGTCPLNCHKCLAFNGKSGRKKKVQKMPLEKAKWLIDEIAGWEIKPIIQPNIFTEPFANQDLKEIIKYCHENDIFMSIITNGILIDEKWTQFILSELSRKDTISFSLDAISQKTYEKVRGKYDLSKIEDKVEFLLRHRNEEDGPKIGVNYTIEEQNFQETEQFINKWNYKADAVRVNVVFNNNMKIPDVFRKQGVDHVTACSFLDEVMTIDADGHVRVCQNDAFGDSDFGSVFEKGIMEIWEGNDLNHYRIRQKIGELTEKDYCFQCEASCSTSWLCRETEDFIIKEAPYSIYYNRRNI